MKKTALLATAVAMVLSGSAFAAAHGGSTSKFYGKVNVGFASEDKAGTKLAGIERSGNLNNRFGFTGTEDLGDGMVAFYNMTLKTDVAASASATGYYGWVGVKGGFGSISMGTITNPTYGMAEGYFDFAIGVDSPVQGSKDKNSVLYKKAFGDVHFQAMVTTNPADDQSTQGTSFGIAAPVGPVTLVAVVESNVDNDDQKRTDLGVVYNAGAISAGGALITNDQTGNNTTDITVIQASYTIAANKFTLQNTSVKDGDSMTVLSLQHKMSKNVTAYIENQSGDLKGDKTAFGLAMKF